MHGTKAVVPNLFCLGPPHSHPTKAKTPKTHLEKLNTNLIVFTERKSKNKITRACVHDRISMYKFQK